MTLADGGNGYVQGTYEDVPLGGGEGTGLRATIVVNSSGNISSVTMTDSGHGYDETGNAAGTFVVTLPESYFGLDNGRTRYNHWEANVNYQFNDVIYVGNTEARGFIYRVTLAGSSGTNLKRYISIDLVLLQQLEEQQSLPSLVHICKNCCNSCFNSNW